VAPKEGIERAAVQDLPPLGLLQKRGEEGKPAADGMCPSLQPSRRMNQNPRYHAHLGTCLLIGSFLLLGCEGCKLPSWSIVDT